MIKVKSWGHLILLQIHTIYPIRRLLEVAAPAEDAAAEDAAAEDAAEDAAAEDAAEDAAAEVPAAAGSCR